MERANRTELLLALLLLQGMKGSTLADKAHQLNLAGFSNLEIANILQMKPQLVADTLYRARKEIKARRPKQKKTGENEATS